MLEGLGRLQMGAGRPAALAQTLEQRHGPARRQHPGQAAEPRAQSRVALVVQGTGVGRGGEGVDAGGQTGYRRQLRAREREHLPLHPDRGRLAVDVDGAAVTARRGIDLQVDVEPPPLVVRAVAEGAAGCRRAPRTNPAAPSAA